MSDTSQTRVAVGAAVAAAAAAGVALWTLHRRRCEERSSSRTKRQNNNDSEEQAVLRLLQEETSPIMVRGTVAYVAICFFFCFARSHVINFSPLREGEYPTHSRRKSARGCDFWSSA